MMFASGENYDGCPVRVLGLGNVLVGDDAFGPFVVRHLLAEYEAPEGVEIHDIGTPGLDLAPHIAGCDTVIIVDSIAYAGEPGEVRLYRKDALLARGPTPRSNPHQPSLVDTLFFLDVMAQAPREVILVGTKPARYDTGAPLSEQARSAVRPTMERVLAELERLGYPLRERTEPLDPDIWWEGNPLRRDDVLLSAV